MNTYDFWISWYLFIFGKENWSENSILSLLAVFSAYENEEEDEELDDSALGVDINELEVGEHSNGNPPFVSGEYKNVNEFLILMAAKLCGSFKKFGFWNMFNIEFGVTNELIDLEYLGVDSKSTSGDTDRELEPLDERLWILESLPTEVL